MPNIKSQKKRVITNEKSNDRNKAIKTNLKTIVKKAEASLAAGTEDSQAVINNAQKTIDKAVAKGVLSKNTAARKKASIAKKVKQA
ncbi:MAG: 30S ribosomal protein S20 [Oscillospiraceae bacterium]|nr:30S ribosomal protein S20 [Oscillospiraceae bacterium]